MSIDAIEDNELNTTADEVSEQSELLDARQRYLDCCIHTQQIEHEIRRKKKELKDAREDQSSAFDEYQLLSGGLIGIGDDFPSSAGSAKPQVFEGDEWRNEPITVLDIGSIKGLGPAKRKALIEAIPTIGAFEDLRAEAGAGGLVESMPEGFGQKATDGVEGLLMKWLELNVFQIGKTDHVPVSEPIADDEDSDDEADEDCDEPSGEEENTHPESLEWGKVIGGRDDSESDAAEELPATEPEESGNDESDASDDSDLFGLETDDSESVAEESGSEVAAVEPVAKEPVSDDEYDHPAQVRGRYEELRSLMLGGETIDPPSDNAYLDGKRAAVDGWAIEDCNWTAGENQDSWLLGYFSIMG
jgi:hypothetical protein